MFDFPVTVESIDAVPEEYRFLYEEHTEGDATKHRLIDGLRKRVEVGTGASKALEIERRSRIAAENAAKAWKAKAKELFGDEVESPDALGSALEARDSEHTTALEAARTAAGAGGNKDAEENLKRQIEQVKSEKDREWAKKLTVAETAAKKAEERTAAMQRSLEKHMKTQLAVSAIANAKGRGKILLPHVMSQMKLVEENGEWDVRVVDEQGDDRINSEGRNMSVDELVAQMKQSDEYGFAFEGDGATGSGSRSSAGSGGSKRPGANPWSKKAGTFNVTEQAKLIKSNPGLAKQMQAAAEAESRAG